MTLQTALDFLSDVDEWQTWPGFLILGFRLIIMLWFLMEMRQTFRLERDEEKMQFYLHFGAGYLVWFVYLPILVIISTQVSALWRYKTVLSKCHISNILRRILSWLFFLLTKMVISFFECFMLSNNPWYIQSTCRCVVSSRLAVLHGVDAPAVAVTQCSLLQAEGGTAYDGHGGPGVYRSGSR